MSRKVYVLIRTSEGDPLVDGVFTTEAKAEKYRNELLEAFGVDFKDWTNGASQYDFDIQAELLK